MEKRMGTVLSFDRQYGHGVIASDNGEYHFSHRNILMNGYRSLDPGDVVVFEIGVKGDGLQALAVKLIH